MRAIARALCAALAGGLLLVLATSAWSSPSGASPPDTTYTAVTPCVVFDSRASQRADGEFVGPINGGEAVTYLVEGTFPAEQGGGNTDCGIPRTAIAVEINVVAVNAINEGNLRVSDGSPVTTGGVVNYNNLTPKLNTSNSVIVPLGDEGQLVVTPNCGAGCTDDSTDVRGVVLGYFTDELATRTAATEAEITQLHLGVNQLTTDNTQLEADVDQLQADNTQLQTDVDQLQALLADVTRSPSGVGGQDTLRFSGMNVQIVDGTGTTACTDGTGTTFDSSCNGQGNLIVGYAENAFGYGRTGAHNIVGGPDNGWSSYGGAVLGATNQITNDNATVTGGGGNVASGQRATVSGGTGNIASATGSSISGGDRNTATGVTSSVSGGATSTASGNSGWVGGGVSNTASGPYSSVSAGNSGVASGSFSGVSGGFSNTAAGLAATVSGGYSKTASGDYDWVGGTLFQDS